MRGTVTSLLLVVPFTMSAQLYCTFTVTQENCSEANGTVYAGVWGGTAPYTFQWSPAPPIGQGTGNIAGLAAGNYDLTVTDALALQQTFTATVPNEPSLGPAGPGTMAGAEPAVGLGVPCSGQCNGAMAFPATMFSGTPPYSFNWDPPAAYTAQGDPVFVGLCAGQTYSYVVTDALGCSSIGTTGIIPELDADSHWMLDSVAPATCGSSDGIAYFSQISGWPADMVFSQGGAVVLTVPNAGMGFEAVPGLAAGAYEVLCQYGASGCETSLTFTMTEEGPGCGSVGGAVYLDSDTDCIDDPGEPGVPFRLLQVDPGAQLMITNTDGAFAGGFPDGAYTLTVLDPSIVAACPLPSPVPFTVSGGVTTLEVGAGSSLPLDLSVTAVNGAARPGFVHTVWIHLINDGAQPTNNVQLTCMLDVDMTYSNADPAPTIALGNLLTWNMPPLGAFADTTIRVNAQVLVGAVIGDQVDVVISAVNAGPEGDVLDNTYTTSRIVTGALDPNDKTAFTSTLQSSTDYLIAQDEWIDYVIRFQNTGTDTAFTVVITDTLAAELDMTTFEQGAASHPFTTSFKPGRVVEWHFANILLPDSNTNEPGSHGAVGFRIRPVLPLAPGTALSNAADIFFDFNASVRTNTSTLVASVGTNIPAADLADLRIFPNPTVGRTTITCDEAIRTMRMLGLDGRVLQERSVAGRTIEVDLGSLSPGSYMLHVVTVTGLQLQAPVLVH